LNGGLAFAHPNQIEGENTMACIDFFAPHLAWLKFPNHSLDFLITSNRAEANRFVFFGKGSFRLEGEDLLVADRFDILFSDRVDGNQPFFAGQPEANKMQISVPNGPIERP
jgi:hypothetical protein